MKRSMISYLILFIIGSVFLSGCYQWLSNCEATGTILTMEFVEWEAIADFQPEGYPEGSLFQIRFQLAEGETGGYDRDILQSLQLTGKRCYVKLGPHGVVHQCILLLPEGNEQIPKMN